MKFVIIILVSLVVFSCQKQDLLPTNQSVEVPEVLKSTSSDDKPPLTTGDSSDDSTSDPSITDPNNDNAPKRRKITQH